jgi:hypothetical protein
MPLTSVSNDFWVMINPIAELTLALCSKVEM